MGFQEYFTVDFRGDFVQFYVDFRLIIVVTIWTVLALFGYFYNNAVARKMREGYADHVWLFVVIGVAVTLLGAAIRDPGAALWVLTCFAASGAWMVYGAIGRQVTTKRIKAERMQLAIIEALKEAKQDAKV